MQKSSPWQDELDPFIQTARLVLALKPHPKHFSRKINLFFLNTQVLHHTQSWMLGNHMCQTPDPDTYRSRTGNGRKSDPKASLIGTLDSNSHSNWFHNQRLINSNNINLERLRKINKADLWIFGSQLQCSCKRVFQSTWTRDL